jgi:two-component system torCAD operon response regulator TorR
MRPKLLLVDDDVPSRELLVACLAKQGFDVAGATDAGEARRQLGAAHFDLVLLDINLPGIDGLSLARELRLESEIGIIMLTAREGQMERVLGLEWGADDYVTKETPLAELIARIRALLRRTGHGAPRPATAASAAQTAADASIAFDGWTLGLDTGCIVSPAGEEIKLTKGEFGLLSVLAKNLGKVVARSDLLSVLSSREWSGTERSVDVLVSRLRRKLGDDPRHPRRLITVHGTGYRLVGSN